MPIPGGYTDKFNRRYVYLNPDPFLGPYTQRLSNIPAVEEPNADIENIYTFAPMMHTEGANTAELYFSIEDIPDNARRLNLNIETIVDKTLEYAPFKSIKPFENLRTVNSIKPVVSTQRDKDVAFWFEIENLPDIDVARTVRRMNVALNLPYNSRSIATLTALAPIKVFQDIGNATVSFDLTLLPDA